MDLPCARAAPWQPTIKGEMIMANYFEMSKDQLRAEKAALEQSYAEFKAKGLKLNMARGKPGPHQMDLAMDQQKNSD